MQDEKTNRGNEGTIPEGLEGLAGIEPHSEGSVQAMALSAVAPEETEDTKEYLQAPYSYSMEKNETVALNNGALRCTVTDFMLPGRNGFDLAIARKYSADNANLTEISPKYDETATKFITSGRRNLHEVNTYGLGYGWSFVLPSVESIPKSQRNTYVTYSPFLHLEDGRSFTISGASLKDHLQEDVTLSNTAGSLTHPQRAGLSCEYKYTVSYKTGGKDYFAYNSSDYTYSLVARQDRFGNAIFFSLESGGGMIIVDSWGRDVVLAKSGNTLTWTLPQGADGRPNRIVYTTQGSADAQTLKLASVQDQEGRTTSFTYHDPETYKAACMMSSNAGNTVIVKYMLLAQMSHPTGGVTGYEYGLLEDDAVKPLKVTAKSEGGYTQYFPIRTRRDTVGGTSYNLGEYAFTLSENKKFIEHADVQLLYGVAEKHIFNKENQLVQKQVTHAGRLVQSSNYEYGDDKAQEENYKLILKEEAITHGNEGRNGHKITRWSYTTDKKADVQSLAEEYPGHSELDQLTEMWYGAFSTLTEKKVKKDADTTIAERYELDENLGERVVKAKRVYENTTLRQRTEYDYGAPGGGAAYCITRERRYYAPPGETLAASQQYHAVEYAYDAGKFTHAPVRSTVKGLVDAEGQALEDAVQRFDYDALGRRISATDANGGESLTHYDHLGRVVKEEYPTIGGVRACKRSQYDDALNRITTTDERGYKTRYHYTALGQIERAYLVAARQGETDVLLTSYEYDLMERVACEKTYNGEGEAPQNVRNATAYTYDGFGRVLSKTVAEIGYEETHSYIDAMYNPANPYQVCAMHEKIVRGDASAPDVSSATYTDQAGRTVLETLAGRRVMACEYDKLGNKLAQTGARGAVTTFVCDWAGRSLSTTHTVGGQSQTSRSEYDALGNKTAGWDWAGNKTEYHYDAAGRLLWQQSPFDERSAVTKYSYDPAGNMVMQKLFQGDYWRETEYRYDARGRQTDVYLYTGDGHARYSRSQYLYDDAGNKTEMRTGITESEPAYATVRYEHDRFGNVLRVSDAMGRTESCAYDKTGLLVRKTDRNGTVTTYRHDAMKRLVEESVSVTAHGESMTSRRTCAYARNGQKAAETTYESRGGAEAEALAIEYFYDEAGRLTGQKDPGGIIKAFGYDAAGNRVLFQMFKDAAPQVELWYTYDELERLSEVRRGGRDGEVLAAYEYDANGNRSRLYCPESGVETVYDYNGANLVTRLENRVGARVMSTFGYTYSPDDNQVSKTGGDGPVSYEYDRLGRLVAEAQPGWHAIRYEYDRFSNRSRMVVDTPPFSMDESYTTTYTYDASNRLLEEKKVGKKLTETLRYRYDANGSQVYREAERIEARPMRPGKIGFVTPDTAEGFVVLDLREYDGFGRLTRATRDGAETRYRYRPDRLRHSKTVRQKGQTAVTVHHWDGQNMVLETEGHKIKGRYLRGANLICQVIDLSVFFYLFNAHGDVVQRVGADAAAPKYEYDAFGGERKPKPNDPNPFRYCGEYWDEDLGEIYLRARTYNPRDGRFSAEDGARDGANWYAYCGGNPVTRSDPSGLRYDEGKPGDAWRQKKQKEAEAAARARAEAVARAAAAVAAAMQAAAQAAAIAAAQANGAVPVPPEAIAAPVFSNMMFAEDNTIEVPHGRYGLTRSWSEALQQYTKRHDGVDVSTQGDPTVHSTVTGRVFRVVKGDPAPYSSNDWSYGAYIVIEDDYGNFHIFAHCQENSFYGLQKDDKVVAGQPIAQMGMTGNANTDLYSTGQGAHVHYEVRERNWYPYTTTDPTPWLGLPNDPNTPNIGGIVGSWYMP